MEVEGPIARRAFLQAIGLTALLRPAGSLHLTMAAPGRAAVRWTLRAPDAHRKARECLRGGALGRVVFVSYTTDSGSPRLSIHGADATLTLEEVV